jgi:LacI family transcriptional regulator
MNSGYNRGLLRGIMDYAKPHQRWIFRLGSSQPERISGMLRQWKPEAIILPIIESSTVRVLRRWNQPVVNVGHTVVAPAIPRVGVEDDAVGMHAGRYFLSRGFRNFGYVCNGTVYSRQRYTGFARTLSAAGYKASECGSVPPRALARWLKALPKPAAVFCCVDHSCWETAEVAGILGLRVPGEVALLGVDNDEFQCTLARPPLSSVSNPARQIGYEAAALLDRLLKGNRAPERPILFPPLGVVTRQSTDTVAVEDPVLATAIRYIREHAHEPIGVQNLLDVLPVSRRTLELKFKQALGRGPSRELRQVRVELAQQLLCDTDLPLTTVARRAGFGGLVQLSSIFKQEVGIQPSAFRKKFRFALQAAATSRR